MWWSNLNPGDVIFFYYITNGSGSLPLARFEDRFGKMGTKNNTAKSVS
jgi:hypothetical protein